MDCRTIYLHVWPGEELLQRCHATVGFVDPSRGGLAGRTHRHGPKKFATNQGELVLKIHKSKQILRDDLNKKVKNI